VVESVDALTLGRSVATRAAGVLITAFAVVVGCGEPSPGPTSTTALPPAAEPHAGPEQTESIPGRTVPVGEAPEGIVVDAVTRTVAVAKRRPNELVLLNADTGDITGRTPLPGSVRHLQLAAPGGPVLVPVESANALIRVELPVGRADPPIATGIGSHDATQAQNGIVFVTNEFGAAVAALRGNAVVKDFGGSVQPGGAAAVGNLVGVVDVRKNSLTVYDAALLTVVGTGPAGVGPTHLVGDRHGRMIATDTRGDTIRVFTPQPTPQEIATVAQTGGPYGIAYDATRDRLWVTSTGTNEVVGYDMTNATPREVRRLPTVRNPNTVGVDPATGRLFIAGVSGGVVQIVDPRG
jgi:DNA-binding beta-propeller fold protein YncE